MGGDELGPWEPLPVDEVVALFGGAPFRWWVTGGHALEAHTGRAWRPHDDTDIGIVRGDAPGLTEVLAGWDLHVAAAGILTPWDGGPLDASQGNLWCRRSPDDPWCLDVMLGEGDGSTWIYRRDPSVRFPWEETVLATSRGVPYLAPELQLLFKSRTVRPKDDIDARFVIPLLEPERRARLASLLPSTHPWQTSISERRARQVAGEHLGGATDVELLDAGRSTQAWSVTHDGGRAVVRVPIPGSGRVVTFRSEALIGGLLADAGHPVSRWRTVAADDVTCSLGPFLPGTPVNVGTLWSPAFAERLAALLHDLHRLPASGFGPLVDDSSVLRGRSSSPTRGIVDRWSRAPIWPFDGSSLEDHPVVHRAPTLVPRIARMEQRILDAAGELYGVVHSDLHPAHLLRTGGDLSGVLDFGDAFVGSTAWDIALLHWYHGEANTRQVAQHYGDGSEKADLVDRGRSLAVAVGCYKVAKSPNDTAAAARLEALLR